MRSALPLIFLLALPLAAQEPESLRFGRVDVVDSKVLGESRRLNVLLPTDYAESDAQYPTVYVLDGSAHEDYFHVAGLIDYMATYGMIPRSIVVGISNVDRYRDFTTPSSNEEDRENLPTSGGSAAFLDFVANELIPHVEANYRCAAPRTLIGQSLGGLIAAQFLLERPQLFHHFLIVSPSLWWSDYALIEASPELLRAHEPVDRSVYVSVGNEHPEMIRVAQRLADEVEASAWPGLRVLYDYLPDEDHATALHISVYRGLRFLHPKHPNEESEEP